MSRIKKYEAVIFDLFGTLVGVFSRQDYEIMLAEMARILSAPFQEFHDLWSSMGKQRVTGIFPSIESNIEYICKELGIPAREDNIRKAVAIRLDLVDKWMSVDKGGADVLTILKNDGYKTALISNCSPDAPVVWDRLPYKPLFDVVIFSCEVGLEKPDLRIYELAVEKLAVKPEKCLYVGDGAGDELAGAARAGMNPVLIRDPGEDSDDVMRGETGSSEWNGPVISSLQEVLNLVE